MLTFSSVVMNQIISRYLCWAYLWLYKRRFDRRQQSQHPHWFSSPFWHHWIHRVCIAPNSSLIAQKGSVNKVVSVCRSFVDIRSMHSQSWKAVCLTLPNKLATFLHFLELMPLCVVLGLLDRYTLHLVPIWQARSVLALEGYILFWSKTYHLPGCLIHQNNAFTGVEDICRKKAFILNSIVVLTSKSYYNLNDKIKILFQKCLPYCPVWYRYPIPHYLGCRTCFRRELTETLYKLYSFCVIQSK